MKKLSLLLVICIISAFSYSQNPFILSEIMKGKDFIGYWPEQHFWHVEGDKIIFRWNPENKLVSNWHQYTLSTGKISEYDTASEYGLVSFDKNQIDFPDQYSIVNGQLIRFDKKTKTFQKIYTTTENIRNLQRLNDPQKVVFQLKNNLFVYNRADASILQITDFRLEDEKKESISTNHLTEAEEELFQFIRDQNEMEKIEANNKPKKLKTIYLGKNNLDFLTLSPDEQMVYLAVSSNASNTNTTYTSFVNKSGQTQSLSARPKVGEEEQEMKLFHFTLSQQEIKQISMKSLSNFQKKPSYFSEYGDSNLYYMTDRLVHIMKPIFSKNSTPTFDIRALDNKDRWLVTYDTSKSSLTEFSYQHDEAWIGGPGIESWDVVPGTLFWVGANQIVYQSEKTGYSHLYLYNTENKKTTTLTEGNYEIHKADLSLDKKSIFILANKNHPGNRSYYQVDLLSKKWKTIWEDFGAIDPELSPDQKSVAALISNSTTPWELFILKNQSLKQITFSTSSTYKSLPIQKPELITFKGKDGKTVYARSYSPISKANKAAVIFVHGAGYLQNAHEYWSNYYREFLFHQLLINEGYTVLDIDYRASEGYGRDYRTAIYRHMGGMDLMDQLSGKEYLVNQKNIDSSRVGIYGGSYGGFITLMALLTTPNEFACGAALRSVTDWAHYNHEYTSDILNYPTTDPKAYKRSSPIYFAENLNKPLVMLHGMVDDNVQFQDVVRLSQRFIELGKTNWDLAVYPIEAHGFTKSTSWTDEYRRILELFNRSLLK